MLTTLAIATWVIGILMVLFLAVCSLLILTVLIQKPQGGGLSAAFGASSGSGQTAFGTKTGDALTIFTIIVFVAFLGVAIGLNYAAKPSKAAVDGTTIQDANMPAPSGAAPTGSPPAPTPVPIQQIEPPIVPTPANPDQRPSDNQPGPATPSESPAAPPAPSPTEPAPENPSPK